MIRSRSLSSTSLLLGSRQRLPGAHLKKHIIISIHGIRTYGRWQERLGNLLRAENSCAEYHIYTYGYFSAVAFLIPPLRWLVVRRFRKCVLTLHHDNPDARIDLVAHSFGTHIAAWAILDTPSYIRPNVHTLILAGSVLKAGFPWEELISANAVRRVVNDCGIDDKVLILNQLCVLFTGMAGRIGFAGLTGDRLVNRSSRAATAFISKMARDKTRTSS